MAVQGTVATLSTTFLDGASAPVDATGVTITITDALGVNVVNAVAPIHVGLGVYVFSYLLPPGAALGTWNISWSGAVGLSNLNNVEALVVTPGVPVVLEAQREESIWVPRWTQDRIGIMVYRQGAPYDPDGNAVSVTSVRVTGGTLFTRTAVREASGIYHVDLGTEDTASPGQYRVTWTYAVAGVTQTQETTVEVGQVAPDYAALDAGMRYVVDQVWSLFSDGFDSPYGGPNLQTYYQAKGFGRNRLAQLLHTAMNRLNNAAQPHMTYTVNGVHGAEFPLANWGGILEKGLMLETLKHLMRGYVEQPMVEGVGTARVDRRDYLQRWETMYALELEEYEGMFDTFKIAHMGLGRARALVSGGAYGNFGPNRLPLSAAARPRYWASIVH